MIVTCADPDPALIYVYFKQKTIPTFDENKACVKLLRKHSKLVAKHSNILLLNCSIKANASRYKQCELTPHFSTGQNILKKKKMRKDNY